MVELDYGLIGLLIVGGQVIVELFRQWIIRLIPQRSVLTSEEQHLLHELYNMHNKTDSNGVPIWYVPRSLLEQNENIVNTLLIVSTSMQQLVKTSEQNQRDMLGILRSIQKEVIKK